MRRKRKHLQYCGQLILPAKMPHVKEKSQKEMPRDSNTQKSNRVILPFHPRVNSAESRAMAWNNLLLL